MEFRLGQTRTENAVKKFRHVVPEKGSQTNIQSYTERQTDRHARHNTPLPYREGVMTVVKTLDKA